MFSWYVTFLNDFQIVPVAPIFIGINFVFTFHMRCISIVRFIIIIIIIIITATATTNTTTTTATIL